MTLVPEQSKGDNLLARLETVGGAQGVIAEALHDVHTARRVINDKEISPAEFVDARNRLRIGLSHLPKDVVCISIIAQFPRVEKEAEGNVQHELRTLQHLVGQLVPETQTNDEVRFEFVVRPNYVPEELKHLHFGSRARDLEPEVIETLRISYSSETNILEVKPHGGIGGLAGLEYMDVKPMRIPLRYVQNIQLHTDQKPLTPYLEGRDWEKLKQVPVNYAKPA